MKNNSLVMLFTIAFLGILLIHFSPSDCSLVEAQTAPRIFVDPPQIEDTTKGIGSTFTVNVNIMNVENLYGWQVNMTFYPEVVTTTGASITEGSFLQEVASTTFLKSVSNTAGYLLVSGSFSPPYPPDGAYGSGTLASITFTVQAENRSTPLHFTENTKLRSCLNDFLVPIEEFTTEDGYFSNCPKGPNMPPIASFSVNPQIAEVYDPVHFDASASYDPDGFIVSYRWDFGDGTTELRVRNVNFSPVTYHAYSRPGAYIATLNVTDDDGGSASSQAYVFVSTRLMILLNPRSGTVGTMVKVTGFNATPNGTVDIFWRSYVYNVYGYVDTLVGTILANSTGEFETSFQIPASTMSTHYVKAEDVTTRMTDDESFTVIPSISIDPTSGPIGTKITVRGTGFPFSPYGPVAYTMFDDQIYGYVSANANGNAQATINVPIASPGPHVIRVMTPYYSTPLTIEAIFSVIDTTALDVTANVGAFYFKGETAEFFVLTALKGAGVDVTSLEAMLALPNGTTISLSPAKITTGLYKIEYVIKGKSSMTGTYALVVKANYIADTTVANGTALATFIVKPTWEREAPKIAGFSIASVGLLSAMVILWRREAKKFAY